MQKNNTRKERDIITKPQVSVKVEPVRRGMMGSAESFDCQACSSVGSC